MNITRRLFLQVGLGTALYPLWQSASHAFELSPFGVVEGLEDFWLATDADVYGYPLVTMEMTRRVITNVPKVEGTRGVPPRGRGLEKHCGGGPAQLLVDRVGPIRREAVRLRTGNGLGEAVVGRPAVASLQ